MTTFVEFHILQSFPVNNLNRDDLGNPKTAVFGGVTRARISSQCFKRAVRLKMRDLGVEIGLRTSTVAARLAELLAQRNPDVLPQAISETVDALVKIGRFDNLTLLTTAEYEELARLVEAAAFDPDKLDEKAVKSLPRALRKRDGGHCGLDISLFGRMNAVVRTLDVEAAASFAHALTTHAVASGIDYFTAMDDVLPTAGYIDAAGFSAGVFYRYVVVNIDRLRDTLGLTAAELQKALEIFTEALFLALPAGRQNAMSAKNFWDYAKVLVRTGQPVQANFEKPVVPAPEGGILEPSIRSLNDLLARSERLAGDFYGKLGEFEFGTEDSPSINDFARTVSSFAASRAA